MTTEDQNPDRLCEPQYHRSNTIKYYMSARNKLNETQRQLEKLQDQKLLVDKPELEKRELEIREWMRRDKLDQAVYPLGDGGFVLFVRARGSYATFEILPVQRKS